MGDPPGGRSNHHHHYHQPSGRQGRVATAARHPQQPWFRYLSKSLKRTSPPKLSTISPNPSKLCVQLVHGADTDPAEVLLALGVPVSESQVQMTADVRIPVKSLKRTWGMSGALNRTTGPVAAPQVPCSVIAAPGPPRGPFPPLGLGVITYRYHHHTSPPGIYLNLPCPPFWRTRVRELSGRGPVCVL